MAVTLPKLVPLGGGVSILHGTYSHTVGAALETFNVGSARVREITISNMDSGGKHEPVAFSESVSGSTNTVTILKNDAMTDGRIQVTINAGS